jgi:hypothetical protein
LGDREFVHEEIQVTLLLIERLYPNHLLRTHFCNLLPLVSTLIDSTSPKP